MTAEWESKLQSIEEGTYDKDAFYKEMIDYVVKETDDKKPEYKNFAAWNKGSHSNCPKWKSLLLLINIIFARNTKSHVILYLER